MSDELVSVITVCYNSDSTILDCIASVNNQKYKSIEHIFIDGGSKDNTINIIKDNSKRSPKIVSERDNGIYDAMNKGLRMASGSIIGFLNSDDYFFSTNSISSILEGFSNEIQIVHGSLLFINNNGNIKRHWKAVPFTEGLFRKSMSPAHPTFYCKRSVYDDVGEFSLEYDITGDLEFMFRALQKKKYSSNVINKVLVIMRLGGNSTNSFNSTINIFLEVRRFHFKHNTAFNSFIYWYFKFIKFIKQKIIKNDFTSIK